VSYLALQQLLPADIGAIEGILQAWTWACAAWASNGWHAVPA